VKAENKQLTSSSEQQMQYVLDKNDSNSIVEYTLTKHESIQVHVHVQIIENCQHSHCNGNISITLL